MRTPTLIAIVAIVTACSTTPSPKSADTARTPSGASSFEPGATYQICKIKGSTRPHLIKTATPELAVKIAAGKLALSNALAALATDQKNHGLDAEVVKNNLAIWSSDQLDVKCKAVGFAEASEFRARYGRKDSVITSFEDSELIAQILETELK